MIAQRMIGALPAPRWAFVPLRDVYIAIGCICIASSALSIAQATFGWFPFPVWSQDPVPGLFFNSASTGVILALALVTLVVNRLYWFVPGLLPGLYLAHSRGGWAALALGLLATRFRHPLWLLVLVLAIGCLYSISPSASDLQRLHIWRAAWVNLSFWGNGFNSFQAVYMMDPAGRLIQPEYAHNEYLQTVFEFGVWSVIPFSVVAWAASRSQAKDWPTLVTFLFIACFSMPLHMPMTFALGSIALATVLLEKG